MSFATKTFGIRVCHIANDFPPGAAHISKTASPAFKFNASTGRIEAPSNKKYSENFFIIHYYF